MNITNRYIWGISLAVLLALAGLVFIQFNWLKGVITIREEQFNEKAGDVIKNLPFLLAEKVGTRFLFHKLVRQNNEEEEAMFLKATNHLIDSLLNVEKLNTSYEFGLKSCKSEDYLFLSDQTRSREILEGRNVKLDDCRFSNSEDEEDHLHLYLHFPRKYNFVLSQLFWAIAISILPTFVLIGAFAYTLSTIFKQKKLSVMKNELIGNLTHEFKTPIASISLAAKTLKYLPAVAESGKALNYIDLINNEGKRLENHVDKVLQMATLDSGVFRLDESEVDVHQMLEKVIESLDLIVQKKGGQIQLDALAKNPNIQADKMHLFNIFYNLIDNAIKFCDESPVIKIKTESTDEQLVISVRDNGIGIDQKIQDKVFDKFYRQENGNVHNVKGFGLGLSYVKRIVDEHKGQIKLNSKLGEGTEFILRFPATKPD